MPDYGKEDQGLYERINKDMSSLKGSEKPIGEVSISGNRSGTYIDAAVNVSKSVSVGVNGFMWEGRQYPQDVKFNQVYVKAKGKF